MILKNAIYQHFNLVFDHSLSECLVECCCRKIAPMQCSIIYYSIVILDLFCDSRTCRSVAMFDRWVRDVGATKDRSMPWNVMIRLYLSLLYLSVSLSLRTACELCKDYTVTWQWYLDLSVITWLCSVARRQCQVTTLSRGNGTWTYQWSRDYVWLLGDSAKWLHCHVSHVNDRRSTTLLLAIEQSLLLEFRISFAGFII